MTNLDSVLKSRGSTLLTKVHLVKAIVFPVVMYGWESWTIKKPEHWRIDAFKLWCWRRLLRVPWTARSSNQSILKEGFPCSSVGKSCPTLCDPMDCSTPGFPYFIISQSLLKLMSVESVMPSNHLILCHPLFLSCLQSFPPLGSFPLSCLFVSGDQSTGASALTSILSMNIQGWFPLGLMALISLLSRGLSRVFSSTTVRKHQLFSAQTFYGPTLTSILA